jgi:hypothetical protein
MALQQQLQRLGGELGANPARERLRSKNNENENADFMGGETKTWAQKCKFIASKICDSAHLENSQRIDPYVKVLERSTQTCKVSRYIPNLEDGSDAIWNSSFEFEAGADACFVLQVWDRDIGHDDFLGYCELSARDVDDYFKGEQSKSSADSKLLKLQLGWEDQDRGDLFVRMSRIMCPDKAGASLGVRAQGCITLTLVSGHNLFNPMKEENRLDADPGIMRNGGLLCATYFLTGCGVYISTCTTLHEEDGQQVEGRWTVGDTLYFSVVTITTTGYGDLLPQGAGVKLFTAFYAFIGVVIISSIMGFFVGRLMEKGQRTVAIARMKDAMRPPAAFSKGAHLLIDTGKVVQGALSHGMGRAQTIAARAHSKNSSIKANVQGKAASFMKRAKGQNSQKVQAESEAQAERSAGEPPARKGLAASDPAAAPKRFSQADVWASAGEAQPASPTGGGERDQRRGLTVTAAPSPVSSRWGVVRSAKTAIATATYVERKKKKRKPCLSQDRAQLAKALGMVLLCKAAGLLVYSQWDAALSDGMARHDPQCHDYFAGKCHTNKQVYRRRLSVRVASAPLSPCDCRCPTLHRERNASC